MNKAKQREFSCPHCAYEQEFSVWEKVNVTLEPHLKNQVLTRALGRNTCSNCARTVWVGHPIHYQDASRKLMIWLRFDEPQKPPFDEGSVVMNLMVNGGYAFRLVNSYNELIEKIRVFDDRLDDRALEVLKAVCVTQQPFPADQKVFYDGIVEMEGAKKAVRQVIVKRDEKSICEVPLGELHRQQAVLAGVSKSEDERGKWLCVDLNYASELLRRARP